MLIYTPHSDKEYFKLHSSKVRSKLRELSEKKKAFCPSAAGLVKKSGAAGAHLECSESCSKRRMAEKKAGEHQMHIIQE